MLALTGQRLDPARRLSGQALAEVPMMTLAPSDPPIEEVLLSLADSGWKGSVVAACPRHTRRLFIDGGELVGVSSDNPPEWLGHFLVGSSLLSEEQLHAALAGQEQDAVPLGVIVERTGLVDQQALQKVLGAQAGSGEGACRL